MSVLDNVLDSIPYSNILNAPNQKELNKKFEIFSDASITKEEKIQRLSVINKFDMQMVETSQAGMWVNSLSELIFSSDSNDKSRRIEGYRQMSGYPEVSDCLREVCDEFIVKDENGKVVQFALRGDHNEEIKETVKNEFYKFLEIFTLEAKGWDYMRNFLVEGEMFFENIVSVQKPELGIIGLTKIGSDRIDPFYFDLDNELISLYVLRKKMLDNNQGSQRTFSGGMSNNLDKKNEILFLNEKQVTYVQSGEWDDSGRQKYRKPHIEHGSRPYRHLALIEDATIIYMLVRAPERLVFNIDTGHLPPGQAESYMKKQMAEFWNRKGVGRDGRAENVYDPMTMLENYYFAKPRGSDGSTVQSIGGGQASPDNIEILTLFINRLYKSMGVPLQRLNSETAFSDGMDVTREELRFAKFIIRLQQRFAEAIKSTFITHLKLKGRKVGCSTTASVTTINSESKEWYDFSDWKNYDLVCEKTKKESDEKVRYLKEQISFSHEKMDGIKKELNTLDTLVTEQDIKDERQKVLTEAYGDNIRNIHAAKLEIQQVQEDSEPLWAQYGLREEDIDIEFNKPSQFFALKEQQMWQLKFESYQSLASDDLISTTLAQKTFLGWSDQEILQNREAVRKDAALRWELANIESAGPDFREQMAGAGEEGMGGGMDGGMDGGMGGGFGDDLGGGMGAGEDTDLPEFGGDVSDDAIASDTGVEMGASEDSEIPPAPPM
jgi:hypothetical protein|tara:strand:+ start:4416 stop:6575 length:2160 start_codon:yes stop_codon:yes gene_type:complete